MFAKLLGQVGELETPIHVYKATPILV